MPRLLLPLLLLVLAGCSPLLAFNALIPKDEGARLAARDLAYAPGERRRLDVYAPMSVAARPLPIIVFFYGGSWKSGSKEGYGFVGRALAAQGFVVAVPDYRLVPEVRFPGFVEDSAAAVKWVRANIARFGGDPDRIVLAGHSAGAYNAAMLALDPRWLGEDRAAVKGWAALAGPYEFLPLDTEVTKDAFAAAEDLEATQPILLASADDPPALLLAGGEDELVIPSQSTGMAIALVEAGAKAEALVYPDLGHVGVVTALSMPFRDGAPVLRDMTVFARQVTAERSPAAKEARLTAQITDNGVTPSATQALMREEPHEKNRYDPRIGRRRDHGARARCRVGPVGQGPGGAMVRRDRDPHRCPRTDLASDLLHGQSRRGG